jgi:PleD family two-component response regulator
MSQSFSYLKDNKNDISSSNLQGLNEQRISTMKLPVLNNIISFRGETRRQKILIVDDEIFNLQALRVIFKYVCELPEDDLVVSARNGLEALEIIRKDLTYNKNCFSSFSLILMDCNMPVMDGYAATEMIR